MTTPLLCLLGFAVWTLLVLLGGVVGYRVTQVLAGRAKANAFVTARPTDPEWYVRAQRAHLNCVENLPVFGTVVLVGAASGLADPTFDTLAQVYLGARIAQTLLHLSSGRAMVVNVRFTFFIVQLVCVVWMAAIAAGLA